MSHNHFTVGEEHGRKDARDKIIKIIEDEYIKQNREFLKMLQGNSKFKKSCLQYIGTLSIFTDNLKKKIMAI